MSKVCLIALIAFFAVTAITARSTEQFQTRFEVVRPDGRVEKCNKEAKHGDPCNTSNDCRCGRAEMSCNAYAKRCQVVITPDDLQKARDNLKPPSNIDRPRPQSPRRECSVQKRHGDSCEFDGECCNNSVKLTCNRYAKRCQVEITPDELQKAKANLRPVGTVRY